MSKLTIKRQPARHLVASALLLLVAASGAQATNGYFSHGTGVKSQGLAGIGAAVSQDGLAAAANPAGTAALDSRLDLGLTLFRPTRGAEIVGNAFGPDARYSGNGRSNFFIPELGYVHRLSPTLSVGLAVYGNGGMNTDYTANPYGRFGATGEAGVNLEQLFVSPSVAWNLGGGQRLGVALNVAHQRFQAKGVGLFAGFSSSADHLSDRGLDTSTGLGVRLGWQGELAPGLTAGAAWASKIEGRFDKYRGLFADRGGFDVPENASLGLAWQAAPLWNVAGEWQHIRYGDVGSVGNPVAALYAGTPLGASQGPGFGWRHVNALKLGVTHQAGADLVLRAGYSHANQPVPASQTFFNILAPGVVQSHWTLGATWRLAGGGELSGFFLHAPQTTVRGSGSIPPGLPAAGGLGGGEANVRLRETAVGVAYGWKL